MADVALGHMQAEGVGGRRRLIIPMQKTGGTGTTDFFFSDWLLCSHFTIETEIPLADKQQPVAMGTMKTGIPNDQ